MDAAGNKPFTLCYNLNDFKAIAVGKREIKSNEHDPNFFTINETLNFKSAFYV